MTFYCPTKSNWCHDPGCAAALAKFDNGSLNEGVMPCGESWLDIKMKCDECGELRPLRNISFRVCSGCRDREKDDSDDEDENS